MMGMYTELMLSCNIADDQEVVEVLETMLGMREVCRVPDHPLFTGDTRWRHMLRGASHYFVPFATHLFKKNVISGEYGLIVRCDFKNYNDEINLFMNWLDQHIKTSEGEMVGYCRYEEDNDPTILRKGGRA